METTFEVQRVLAADYDRAGGRYTGTVASSLAERAAKHRVLGGCVIETAFGDSEGDADMLERMRRAVCVTPTPAVASLARGRTWLVVDGDSPVDLDQVTRYLVRAES